MKATVIILNLIKSSAGVFSLFLIAFVLFGLPAVSAQDRTEPKSKTEKIEPKPKIVVAPTPTRRPFPQLPPKQPRPVVMNESPTPAEKTIAVESKVYISLCVTEGNVKINGWERNEVRAFVNSGTEVGFKIARKNPRSNKPELIFIWGYDPSKNIEGKPEECLSGSEIELDVPRGATVNVKSGESETAIDSIRKASVKNVGGGIFLRNIAEGVEAVTYEGDVTVEKSSGAMNLETAGGNIVALDVDASEIGDIFRAKTKSGIITLKSVGHSQIETVSISGSTSFSGELTTGGKYGFSTQNGSIVLAIPPESSCKVNASFGYGAFTSELPLEKVVKQAQSLSAQLGAGECTLNLQTLSGAIRIKKQMQLEPVNRLDKNKAADPVVNIQVPKNRNVKLRTRR